MTLKNPVLKIELIVKLGNYAQYYSRMNIRFLITFCIFLILTICSPVIVHSEEPWLGRYAGNRIPLRDVISSVYVAKLYSAVQSSLATHFRDASQDYIAGCKSDGGHAIVNMTMSASMGEVLIGSVSYKNGIVLAFSGDCVTESRPAAK